MRHTLSYVKNHPNPQLFREDYLLLNGKWDFMFDDDNSGISHQWHLAFPTSSKEIIVPYAYQTEDSQINEPTHQCDVIWYHKTIELTKISEVINLIFNGVDYDCQLFVNGNLVGSHCGGYDIFKFDIAKFVKLGKNVLTLRIVDKMNIDQIRGKQRWRQKSFECFYTETSGIWKDVYIDFLSSTHIDSFYFRPSFKNQNVSIEINTKEAINSTLNIKVLYLGETIHDEDILIKDNKEIVEFEINKLNAWSVENPNLYDVILTLSRDTIEKDKVISYFGFNDVSSKNGHIYLNNKDTYLKLILDQGYYPGGFYTGKEDQFINDIKLMKEMGFNGCRKHEKIETPLFNYYCDVLGFLMWQELPSAHKYSYNYITTAKKEIKNQIFDHYNHPSIMCYVIFNESWGINEVATVNTEIDSCEDVYKYVKSLVPNRFIISNDGWEHTTSDLITFHNYEETYDQLFNLYKEELPKLKRNEEAQANKDRKMLVKGFSYTGQPLIFSEFCGLAFTKDKSKGWGYNLVKDEKEFEYKIRKQIEAIRDLPDIRGYCFTQLSDVEIEVNGLVDFERKLKIDSKAMKEINDICK